MRALIFLMAAVTTVEAKIVDGDAAFVRVDNRRPAHALEPGVVQSAVNKQFNNGRMEPRQGIACQAWGKPWTELITAPNWGTPSSPSRVCYITVNGLNVGQTYFFRPGNQAMLAPDQMATGLQTVLGIPGPTGTILNGGPFIATQRSYYIFHYNETNVNAPIQSAVYRLARPRALKRLTTLDGFDQLVMVNDDWRDGVGEDGGRGRAWRITPGNAPQAIPLNGHDVWGEARLVPCYNGLILLRQDNERHYFVAADVDTTNSRFNLHCAPTWNTGDLVLFNTAQDGSAVYGSSPPNPNTTYYVKNIGGGNAVELYADAALTTKLSFTNTNPGPVGKFYLQRVAVSPGAYGNVSPPLLIQGSDQTLFQAGFTAAPTSVAITSTTGTNSSGIPQYIVTAPNHRLLPGDAVTVTGLVDGSSSPLTNPRYANPLDPNHVQLYDTQIHALAGGTSGLQTLTASQTGSLVKQSASGQVMPGGRFGVYFLQRNIIVNGTSNIMISDPLDPLHFTPMSDVVNAGLGENEEVTGIGTIGYDTLLIFTFDKVLAIQNLSQAQSNWVQVEVTREYGSLADQTTLHVGADVWTLARRGVVNASQTAFGQVQGVPIPVSYAIPKVIGMIDFVNAGQACAATWNNRVYFAAPQKGQTGVIMNNMVFTSNNLNLFLAVEQQIANEELVGMAIQSGRQPDAWEGYWTGEALTPRAFDRLVIDGDERLAFVNEDGNVCWFGDDWTDMGTPIADTFTSRQYFGGRYVLTLAAEIEWETFQPNLTVSVAVKGYNESQTLASGLTYDRTQYAVYKPGGVQDTDFTQPKRQDYSMVPDIGLYSPGVPFDVHQNSTKRFRFRMRDRGPAVTVANANGSTRIVSVSMSGLAVKIGADGQV